MVSIAVPTPLHFEIARAFLEAGISVLVEKPLTTTLEEARELFRVAGRHHAVLHVGHVERFNGAVQELRKIVANPILVESRRLGPFVPRVQHDSVIMDLMIHDIDIVLGLVDGEVRGPGGLGGPGPLGSARRGERADRVRGRRHREHHGEPGHRAEGALAGHHPARRLRLPRLHRPGHPDPPPGRLRVRARPRVHPLSPGIVRRAPVRSQGESAQAGDPPHPAGGAPGQDDGRGRAAPSTTTFARSRWRWPSSG